MGHFTFLSLCFFRCFPGSLWPLTVRWGEINSQLPPDPMQALKGEKGNNAICSEDFVPELWIQDLEVCPGKAIKYVFLEPFSTSFLC